jgi:hypothetical protein
MNEDWKKLLCYSDGTQFDVNGDPEDVITKLLNNEVCYKGKSISYNMKCMLAAWNLRNFSAHNLTGIDNLLSKKYHDALRSSSLVHGILESLVPSSICMSGHDANTFK